MTVVVGIGNPGRGDDGVGPLVAARVAALHLPGVEVVSDAEPFDLLPLLERPGLLVVVDAIAPQASPGRVSVVPVDELAGSRAGSRAGTLAGTSGPAGGTHGFGVLETVALAGAVGRMSARVVVVGVEAAMVGHGAPLSPEVAAGLDDAVRAVQSVIAGEAGFTRR